MLKDILYRATFTSAHQTDQHGQFELYHSKQVLCFVVFLQTL